MTNKTEMASVPRELLERLAYGEWECVSLKDRDILRALLAAPAEDIRAVGEEPVAYADPKSFENFNNLAHLGGLYTHEWMWAQPAAGLVPLYRRPQRSIVLPERCDESKYRGTSLLAVRRWNACIDEFERLNKC